jgi:hypothetical protein
MAVSRLSQQSLQQAFPKGNTFWDGTTATSAFDSLGAVLLSASASSVTFSNIPQTYTHLQLRVSAKNTLTNNYTANFYMRFNGDSTTLYNNHGIYGNGTSAVPNIPSGTNPVFAIWGLSGSAQFATSIIDILDYTNTSKFKTVKTLMGTDNVSAGILGLESGTWRSNNAITSITFSMADGDQAFASNSQLSLYGVK